MTEAKKSPKVEFIETVRSIYVDEKNFNKQMPPGVLSELILELEKGYLPLKYTYYGEGAVLQDDIASNLENEFILDSSVLMSISENILQLLKEYPKINVLDIGCGDGLPVKEFLLLLALKEKLNSYLPVDISTEAINLATKNLIRTTELQNNIFTKGTVLDFEKQDLDVKSMPHVDPDNANLLLMLGGTIGNYPTIELQTELLIRLTKNIPNCFIFISSDVVDTSDEREHNISQSTQLSFLPKLLGLSQDDFQIYYKYQKDKDVTQYYLQTSSSIKLRFPKIGKTILLDKGTKIIIYEHKSDTPNGIQIKCNDASLKVEYIKYQDYEDRTFVYYLCSKKL